MAQLTYPNDFEFGFEGMMADGGPDRYVRSYVNSAADMEFGYAAVQGPSDAEIRTPSGAADVFVGITVHTHATERYEQGPMGGPYVGIPSTHPANVMAKGRVIVVVENAVAPGDDVYVRFQNAGAAPEAVGRFRNDADAGDAFQVTAARWLSSAAAGEKAILEVNLP